MNARVLCRDKENQQFIARFVDNQIMGYMFEHGSPEYEHTYYTIPEVIDSWTRLPI
jgi:hypothetical protein